MKKIVPLLSLLILSFSSPPRQDVLEADLILTNGAIYTMDAVRSWVEALAVKEGKIIYAGPRHGLGKIDPPSPRIIDLGGRMVLPAFHDSHVHPVSGGLESNQCELNGLSSVAEVLARVKACALGNPEKLWITGGGWELPLFPGAHPRKEALDEIVRDRPVYLTAADGHSAWVNTRALALAGIDADTSHPENGHIEKDPHTGEPTGTLREAAMELVERLIPRPSLQERVEGLKRALQMANGFGITSIQEANGSRDFLEAYAALESRGELTARVVVALRTQPQGGIAQLQDLKQLRAGFGGQRLRATAAKIFVDGVIESHTAALLEPYTDTPGVRGQPRLKQPALNDLVAALDEEAFQVHMHAIGDRAVRMALDAVQVAHERNGYQDRRHHISHLQLIDPTDIARFRSLQVIANIQPLWAYADTYITELTQPLLGSERSRWLYPFGSLYRSGAVMVAGSDWSVSSMNPLLAIQVALTRKAIESPRSPSWLPEQKMELPAMLALYTINGAFLNHQEKRTGSLELGKEADLIVLDRNLFEIPDSEIHRARVLLTLLAGQEVFRHPEF